ncbi:MAG: PAS domain S-box protein [Desulfotalea sp.]
MPNRSTGIYFYKCFSAIFLTTICLVAILLVIPFQSEKKYRRAQLESAAFGYLKTEQKLVSDLLNSITSDLLTLAQSSDAQLVIARGIPPRNLLANLLIFSRNQKVYDQIRYLSKSGQEVVRVNYNNGEPAYVLSENLQNKAGRYYFKDAIKLDMGEIFISPFDLNIEHGQIEKPLKPTIRFGTPIFDNQGNIAGLLLLNYLGAELLSVFDQDESKRYESLFVLNKKGYWLKGQEPSQEWGFMYEDKQEVTFANKFPSAWKQIQNTEFGQFDFQGGLITFRTIYPLVGASAFSSVTDHVQQSSGNRSGLLKEKQYFWKIVHYISPEKFSEISKNHTVTLFWVFASLSLVVAFTAWLFATLMMRKRNVITQLKESEERFKALHEASFGGILIHDQKIILDCNNGLSELSGFTNEELIGMDVFKLIAQDSLDEVLRNIKTGSDRPYEIEGVRKDGSVFPLLIRGKNIPYKNKIVRVVEFRDITESKRYLLDLEESEEMFRALFEQTGGCNMILEPTANGIPVIFDANKAACEAYGYTREQMIGKPVSVLNNEKDTSLCMYRTEHILSGKALRIEKVNVKSDGSTFPVAVFANVVKFKNKPPLILTTQFDISERLNAEEERQFLEKQLQQAQKMEAIGTLAGGIAHDFNNILSAIYGYTQLARMSSADSETQKESLDGVYQAAGRAKKLVKQILTFSRQGNQEKLSLSIANIANETVAMLRQTMPATIAINYEITSDWEVPADPTKIHQVIMNLCTNAYHSMRQKGGTLNISVIDRELEEVTYLCGNNIPPGKYIMISINDSGTGMDDSTMKKIFDPFFTTKMVGDGTGLGLAVVHGIVADHKGHILVESKLDVGTTFHVYLPVSDEEGSNIIATSAQSYGLHGSERILFVDDENDMQKIASSVFCKYGYQAKIFGDPIEALESFKLSPDKFDLLITDMTMPKMTGVELIHKVLEIRPSLPVILCTGHSDLINAEDAHKQGITNFVEKPFTMSKLLSITQKVMRSFKQ